MWQQIKRRYTRLPGPIASPTLRSHTSQPENSLARISLIVTAPFDRSPPSTHTTLLSVDACPTLANLSSHLCDYQASIGIGLLPRGSVVRISSFSPFSLMPFSLVGFVAFDCLRSEYALCEK